MTKDEVLKLAYETILPYSDIDDECDYVLDAIKKSLSNTMPEPTIIGIDFAHDQWKLRMIEFLQEKQICSSDNNKIIIQSWIDELKESE